jgi:hypothetical protein
MGASSLSARQKRLFALQSRRFRPNMPSELAPSQQYMLQIVTALAEPTRMRAVWEIFLTGPSTALPLAKKLGTDVMQMWRHLNRLAAAGVLERGMGRVYKIKERYLVPGQQVVDFGCVVLRFDAVV